MMDALAQFHFIRPVWLLLLPVVTGVWWLWQRRSDPLRGWRLQIDPELLRSLVMGQEHGNRGLAIALLVVWLLAVVAGAGPTWRLEPNPFADDATPLMILLKADTSMETPDPAPTRLERARLKIADLAEARKGQPLGLIAYAGSAHLVLPPTRDTTIVAGMAKEISPAIMPEPGDRLDLALRKAGDVLNRGGQGGTILVMADSSSSDESSLSAPEGLPVQFLAINHPGSSQEDSLRAAAGKLRAKVQPMSLGGEDVEAIVRAAARPPLARAGAEGERWEESGYWILPLIGLVFLATFRRERQTGEVSV